MSIHQLQVAYETLPDRLLLRVSTRAGEEYLAYLTRRFMRQLWPTLAPLAKAEPARADTAAPRSPGRFDQAYEPPANLSHPLGREPLLVGEARIDRDPSGQVVLILREHRQRSMSLTLNDALVQALCAMLRAGVSAADWNLDLDGTAAGAPAATASSPAGTLH